jgi:hypothetical protein
MATDKAAATVLLLPLTCFGIITWRVWATWGWVCGLALTVSLILAALAMHAWDRVHHA